MNIIKRICDALDSPRFCSDCGRAIEVQEYGFDSRTGVAGGKWLWTCPEIHVSVSPREVVVYGGGHDWGYGRPRWYRPEDLP